MALHALSLYATKVFSLESSSTVTVQSSVAGEVYHFDVTRDNRLLYQEKPLKNIPGKYGVKAKGSTCVSVQVCIFTCLTSASVVPNSNSCLICASRLHVSTTSPHPLKLPEHLALK